MSEHEWLEVDYDEETILQESHEKRWTEGAIVQLVLSKADTCPYKDSRRAGAKAVGVTFRVSVVDPELGDKAMANPMIVFCALPLKAPDTPDLQPPDFAMGSGSTWASICEGFIDEYHGIKWISGKAYVNGVELEQAEIAGVETELGKQRVILAKKYYKERFASLLNNNTCYGTIVHEVSTKGGKSWDKPKKLRQELVDGEELTPKSELRGISVKTAGTKGAPQKKAAKKKAAPKKKKK